MGISAAMCFLSELMVSMPFIDSLERLQEVGEGHMSMCQRTFCIAVLLYYCPQMFPHSPGFVTESASMQKVMRTLWDSMGLNFKQFML